MTGGAHGGSDAAARALLDQLRSARAAAEGLAGRAPLGLRAVEPAPGRRGYLCAFEGPAFLCLTGELVAERAAPRARQAASASLLWEHLEALVDGAALRELAGSIGRLLALGGEPAAAARPLETVAARALELAAWREAPERALASVPQMDAAVGLQERLAGAYRIFLRDSEPLVAVQDTLAPELVAALRAVEESAGRAGAAERLAERLAAAVPDCDEGAEQVVAAHLTRLSEEGW